MIAEEEEVATDVVNILLVDDDPRNLIALEAVLAEPGRRLRRAESGAEALRWLLREEFAVIVLDVHMPEMDGFETATLIRQHDRTRTTPIIFLTAANKDPLHVSRGYSLGAIDYLFKPFDPEILRSKVSVFVDLFRKSEQARQLTREQAARVEAEAEQARYAFLAQASQELARLLDDEAVLQRVVAQTASMLGSVCLLDLVEGDTARRVSMASPETYLEIASSEGLTAPLLRRLRDGAPVVLEELSDSLRDLVPDAAQRKLLRGYSRGLLVPVIGNRGLSGVLGLLRRKGDEPFGDMERRLTRDLAQRIALALDNLRLYRELQDAVRARDEFVSSASHDLKTPLTVIKGNIQLLQRKVEQMGEEGKGLIHGLETVESAATRMVRLIDELLDVAMLQAGESLALHRSSTDLVALLHRVVAEIEQSRQDHEVVLEAEDGIVGMWDGVRLERVVGNLLSNAIEYSPAGSTIDITLSRGRDWAVLTITDQGIGIPAEDLPHVFDRFYRARNVAQRVPGTGIGLAGVKQIVDEHGGRITMTSEEGKGTQVVVRLPLD